MGSRSERAETSVFRTQPRLLEAFRQGHRAALETVYRTYARPIDRYLRALARMTGSVELAQTSWIADLLQEVFIRAFSTAGRRNYDGVRDYAPYLTAIARNCFIDALRARGREVPTSPDDLTVALEALSDDSDGWCEPKTLAVLNAYIGGLDDAIRCVYEQRFVLGRSQDEASSALGLTRRAIRTAENHLRRGLRKALSRAGISLGELRETGADLSMGIAASAGRVRSDP